MNKVLILGSPGTGKSTFARALAEKTGIPLCHLDLLFWNADKTTVDHEIFLSRLQAVLDTDRWIIDGNYSSTMQLRLTQCDTVFFLDFPTEIALDGIRARRGKPRPDMPWIEEEIDPEFLDFVQSFNTTRRPRILALLEQCNDKTIYILKSRDELNQFIMHHS